MMKPQVAATVQDYISAFPAQTQAQLEEIRKLIRETVPEAEETISYAMPAYKLHGPLVYFAGYKNHIGFYPGSGPVKAFGEEISHYKHSKGTIQFPLDQPIPSGIIRKITLFRKQENLKKAEAKKKKK